jgi:hypothetical protein
MTQKKKYFRTLDRSAEITSHFNDAVSILGHLPKPELEISYIDDMDGAGGFCHHTDGITVANGSSRHTVYHELSHWVYHHSGISPLMVPYGRRNRHDIVFTCINVGFYALVHPLTKDIFNLNGTYKNVCHMPPLAAMSIYNTHQEEDAPIFRGAYGLLFAERFWMMLNCSPNYYRIGQPSVKPRIWDIPMIAYMAKHLALGSANPDHLNFFVAPKDIDIAIETAMETCMLKKNSETIGQDGKPLRPRMADTTQNESEGEQPPSNSKMLTSS